jgi:hypothetical protein
MLGLRDAITDADVMQMDRSEVNHGETPTHGKW